MKSVLDSLDQFFVLIVDIDDTVLVIIAIRNLLNAADFLSLVHVAFLGNSAAVVRTLIVAL